MIQIGWGAADRECGLRAAEVHYIASLIVAINDAARAAQTSALFLLALGLYLVATVISTTDEDLLRGTAVQVSQLSVRPADTARRDVSET